MKYCNLHHISVQVKGILEDKFFKKGNFREFSKIISKPANIQIFNNFLLELVLVYNSIELNDTIYFDLSLIKVKKILSNFVLLYYPEINNVSLKNKVCVDLQKSSKLLEFNLIVLARFCFNNLNIKNIDKEVKFTQGFIPNIKKLFIKIHNYLELFDSWKRIDLEHIIFNLCYDYYHIEKKMEEKKNNPIMEELMNIFVYEKRKIKMHVRELDSLNGIKKFQEYLDIIGDYESETGFDELGDREKLFAQKISKCMNYNLKKAYWDLLEDEVDVGDYNKLNKSIVELRELIKSCTPSKIDISQELDEVLDEKFIIQKIEKKVFFHNDLISLFEYILFKLKSYQSEFEDESTLDFEKELFDIVNNKTSLYSMGFIIRFFLEWIFPKFHTILQVREYIVNHINKK